MAFPLELRNDNISDRSPLPIGTEEKAFAPCVHELHGDQSAVDFEPQLVHLSSRVPRHRGRSKPAVRE